MPEVYVRLAHDLNNQLTLIQAYCALLLERLPPGEACREEADEIRRAAERARLVARQMLDASRPPRPRGGVADLNRVVTQVAEDLGLFVGADVTLIAECRSARGHVRADASRVEQAVTDLVLRARDALPG